MTSILTRFALVAVFTGVFCTLSSAAPEANYVEDIPFNPISHLPVVVMVFVTLAVTITVAWALTWAGKNGQFENLKQGSECIFDDGEPVGEITDRFPKKSTRANKQKTQGASA